ncbi:CamS family sex pheromone protein [Lactobacillus iners]|uniref:CamS family sex pheromone protein n=1 Tax=Lactobacillus iners TaxID=147802 RepID=UPI001F089857|nr:CamS family sex pheromone protein [Lactobacillus iners]MCT7695794.1 CamS family sex pheromone protein [Lactobacillus iners]MCT7778249.1 CamS family sex pheromone protein [Lactobacillus iners]MCT7881641.1 CamS family sex pheromone protein [Lactobacillus iners]MDK7226930.1 CamS family sex pheromone protein [Lactobacillus iners]MDX5070043.1 CamS family sex pheromone protein [Lactobacillus iners]
MKKLLMGLLIFAFAINLTACGNLKNSNLTNNPANTNGKQKTYQTTVTDKNGYNVLLKDGQYLISPTNGITASNNDNNVDNRSLEVGLLNISHDLFSTDKYVFQEGQVLTPRQVNIWLSRYSKHNKQGLNYKKSKKYSPIILNQIFEQDFLVKSGSSYKLGGISLGLALNSVDYYTKVKDGPEYHVNIKKNQQLAYGKKVAYTLIKRLRKISALKHIPILIGLFQKTGRDSLIGGNYLAYSIVDTNSSKINGWKSVDYSSQVLPTIGDTKPINSTDAASFSDFKAAIQGYFPNISGVIAKVHYQNKHLKQMNISITTQFYGYAQIESFSRLTLSVAKKYLPNNVPIEIRIESVNNLQATITKNDADDSYYVHVFSGE